MRASARRPSRRARGHPLGSRASHEIRAATPRLRASFPAPISTRGTGIICTWPAGGGGRPGTGEGGERPGTGEGVREGRHEAVPCRLMTPSSLGGGQVATLIRDLPGLRGSWPWLTWAAGVPGDDSRRMGLTARGGRGASPGAGRSGLGSLTSRTRGGCTPLGHALRPLPTGRGRPECGINGQGRPETRGVRGHDLHPELR